MAFANTRASHVTLADRIVALTETLKTRLENRRVYKTTLNELSALSNRELSDLSITRGEIRNLALEAAYGK
jgi:uncharacterized protein YjiS (DUF1127 family)